MGLQVNPSLPALLARRDASDAAGAVDRGIGQLASGLRIDRAAVDAAGLAISENLRASIRQENEELRGFQNGISLAQTAEGGLAAQSTAVQRIRELAVQAGNGTLTGDQRVALNAEARELLGQIDRTAQKTRFNDIRPLDGSENVVTLSGDSEVAVQLEASTVESLGLSDVDLNSPGGATAAIGAAHQATQRIDTARTNLGAQANRLESAIRNRQDRSVNEQEARSRLRDVDTARAAIEQTRNSVQRDAGLAGLVQGNLASQTALRLLGI